MKKSFARAVLLLCVVFVAASQTLPFHHNPISDPPLDFAGRGSFIYDDFNCAGAAPGGCLPWFQPNSGFVFPDIGQPGAPGLLQLDTGTVANSLAAIVLGDVPTQDASENFLQEWKIYSSGGTNPTANMNVRFGLFNASVILNPPTGGLYLERCAVTGGGGGCSSTIDTDWFCVANNGGTSTRVDTGVAFTSGSVALQIRRIDSTHIGCKVASKLSALDLATEVTVSGGEPTGALVPGAAAVNFAAEHKQIDIDYFSQLLLFGPPFSSFR